MTADLSSLHCVPAILPTTSPDRSVRTAVMWDLVQDTIGSRARAGAAGAAGAAGGDSQTDVGAAAGDQPSTQPVVLDVLDVGGGTGGFAVPLAVQGHRVTVVDPNPDALASLQRRVHEAGVTVTAFQGDAAGLLDVVAAESADLVLCHGVLEHVDAVAPAIAALAQVLRPGGTLSVLAAQSNAVVLARAMAGRFAEARAALTDPDGRWGSGDPLPRRFTEPGLCAALVEAGLAVEDVQGVRVIADLVPSSAVDHEPGAADDLVELERLLSRRPEFRAVATQLHVRAVKG